MNRIKEDFGSQFQKWFNVLVNDPGKEARIDEESTPLIQQDDVDQDVKYLSGAEKTSVALAYKLALNNIVGKISAGAKSNLLILDEPTDGLNWIWFRGITMTQRITCRILSDGGNVSTIFSGC